MSDDTMPPADEPEPESEPGAEPVKPRAETVVFTDVKAHKRGLYGKSRGIETV